MRIARTFILKLVLKNQMAEFFEKNLKKTLILALYAEM